MQFSDKTGITTCMDQFKKEMAQECDYPAKNTESSHSPGVQQGETVETIVCFIPLSYAGICQLLEGVNFHTLAYASVFPM